MIGLLFLLILKVNTFSSPHNILCSNQQAAQNLVYQICASDKYCCELYNIPFGIVNPDDYNFKNFNKIIKKTGLSYPLTFTSFLTSVNNDIINTVIINQFELQNGLYHKLWSSDWKRSLTRLNFMVFDSNERSIASSNTNNQNLIISENQFTQYNSTLFIENLLNFYQNFDECLYVENPGSTGLYNINTTDYLYNTFFSKTPEEFTEFLNNTDFVNILTDNNIKSINVALSILHILTVYIEHISLNETCNDVNERLYYDPDTDEPRCICLEGKTCDDESSDINIVLWIVVLAVIVIIIVSIVLIYTAVIILQNVRRIKNNRN
jgi:hypothetical protein